MDKIWAYLFNFKDPAGMNSYRHLATVALAVLSLPHTNASEERVFSCVRKNKTAFHASLEDETLRAIISVKLNEDKPCQKINPDKKLLKRAKQSTREYNTQHTSKLAQNKDASPPDTEHSETESESTQKQPSLHLAKTPETVNQSSKQSSHNSDTVDIPLTSHHRSTQEMGNLY